MTEKEKQAKLQYLLNSLSMTKEQKDIVIDLVNSSGNGGGSGQSAEKVAITVDMKNQKAIFQGVEYDCKFDTEELNLGVILNINNVVLNKVLLDYCKAGNWIDHIIALDTDTETKFMVVSNWLDMNGRHPAFTSFLDGVIVFKFTAPIY